MAARVHRGIVREIIRVCLREPKKNKTAIAANTAPEMPAFATSAKELRINRDSSRIVTTFMSAEIKPESCISLRRFFTPLTTVIVLASGCFKILILTAGF